jgi:hypothetical protein
MKQSSPSDVNVIVVLSFGILITVASFGTPGGLLLFFILHPPVVLCVFSDYTERPAGNIGREKGDAGSHPSRLESSSWEIQRNPLARNGSF